MKSVRNAIEDYIALRRSLGFKLRDTATCLAEFAAFLEQKEAPYITTALALEWAMQPVDHQPSDWARRSGLRSRVRSPLERNRSAHRNSGPPVCSRFERGEPVLICTPNRRFKGCWLPPRAFHPRAAFDLGLITVYSGCWQSVGSASARQSSWSGKTWILTKDCSPSAKPSSTRPV